MTPDRRCVMVRVTGHVQGVGFRDWTVRQARGLDLDGWVSNEADGSVKALVCGSDRAVSAMLEAFMLGPEPARVTDVLWTHAGDDGQSGFRIAP
ncbi:acylphosphatase [Ollibium composti]|uniref:acylphosphatase n=1 Tax=Ollibium composti TaxID=2675109 RepID=A0ABY2QBJ8_9HYPH|nr:acylphosphatase [Mesorhizobium composti]THF59063.1 acylphosphatase [Mesorhizobium composti]